MLDIEKLTDALVAQTMRAVEAATAPLVARIAELERALAALPTPRDGIDGKDGADGVPGERGENGDPGAPGRDGADGKDGRDGEPGPRGEKGADGRDGLDVRDLFRAEGGRLVATMSDGSVKDLGVFIGKDGAPGRDGRDGRDGADGLGFDDLTFAEDDAGRPVAKFQRGDLVKQVVLPCIIDRGAYRSGESYGKGDAVSYGGSLWIAQRAATQRPGEGDEWRLAVKKGRDGRDAGRSS